MTLRRGASDNYNEQYVCRYLYVLYDMVRTLYGLREHSYDYGHCSKGPAIIQNKGEIVCTLSEMKLQTPMTERRWHIHTFSYISFIYLLLHFHSGISLVKCTWDYSDDVGKFTFMLLLRCGSLFQETCLWTVTPAVVSVTGWCLFLMKSCFRIVDIQYWFAALSPVHSLLQVLWISW